MSRSIHHRSSPRSNAALAVLLVALSAGALVACTTESDPLSSLTRSPKRGTSSESSDQTAAATTDGGAATTGAAAAPAAAAPPAANAFTDVAPYALITPTDQSANHHGGDSNAGKDCLSCHTGEGAPQFVLGGTVWANSAGANGVSGAQVRVVGANGQEIALLGTDASGNFWLEGTVALPPGSIAGARDPATTRVMSATLGGGSCNQSTCHDSARPLAIGN